VLELVPKFQVLVFLFLVHELVRDTRFTAGRSMVLANTRAVMVDFKEFGLRNEVIIE
jgi:hypothetical protein